MNPHLHSVTVIGSGSEDIGALTAAQSDSDRNRIAEETARNRRLDRDAIVAAALLCLECSGRESAYNGFYRSFRGLGLWAEWISFYVAAQSGRDIHPDTVAALLAEIRAQLSPLVRR